MIRTSFYDTTLYITWSTDLNFLEKNLSDTDTFFSDTDMRGILFSDTDTYTDKALIIFSDTDTDTTLFYFSDTDTPVSVSVSADTDTYLDPSLP